jgi:hypothetical protein
MSKADLFRQYAKEAMRAASKSTIEDEGRVLIDLACTWARAALAGQRVLGSSFTQELNAKVSEAGPDA